MFSSSKLREILEIKLPCSEYDISGYSPQQQPSIYSLCMSPSKPSTDASILDYCAASYSQLYTCKVNSAPHIAVVLSEFHLPHVSSPVYEALLPCNPVPFSTLEGFSLWCHQLPSHSLDTSQDRHPWHPFTFSSR